MHPWVFISPTTAANTNRAKWQHQEETLCNHLRRLSTPPQLLPEPHPFSPSTNITGRPGRARLEGMKRSQNNSTTNPKYTRPTIPNLKKAKERERKQKNEACSPEQQKKKKGGQKKQSPKISPRRAKSKGAKMRARSHPTPTRLQKKKKRMCERCSICRRDQRDRKGIVRSR